MSIVVFAYDFPHVKTEDVLTRLFTEQQPVALVLAAPRVELGIPGATVRTKVRRAPAYHPRDLSDRLGFPYVSAPHDSESAAAAIRESGGTVGLVSGARILGPEIIGLFEHGIVNMHPGLIPEVRGLDALLWAVLKDVPLGVTAHLIDARVDAGSVLARETIPVRPDDTVFDLTERLYRKQLDMLVPAVQDALAGAPRAFEADVASHPYNRKMDPENEAAALAAVPAYVARHTID